MLSLGLQQRHVSYRVLSICSFSTVPLADYSLIEALTWKHRKMDEGITKKMADWMIGKCGGFRSKMSPTVFRDQMLGSRLVVLFRRCWEEWSVWRKCVNFQFKYPTIHHSQFTRCFLLVVQAMSSQPAAPATMLAAMLPTVPDFSVKNAISGMIMWNKLFFSKLLWS